MNKNNKFIFIFFIYTYTHLCFLFFLFFWASQPTHIFGLGPAHPTWTGLDPASPARSLAQASDLAGQKKTKSTREVNSCVHEHCSCNNSIWNEDAKVDEETGIPASGDRRCLQRWWWFSPTTSLCLPSVLTCLYFPFVFSVAFKTTKMMPTCCEFSLTNSGFFLCQQGRKQWKSQYSYLSCSFTFPSLFCVLFFCSVFLLCLSSIFGFSSILGFSSPFIEIQQLASNQSCLCRTVIFHERDRGQETWSTIGSNLL